MLKHRELTIERIHQFGERLQLHIYSESMELEASYLLSEEPLSFQEAGKKKFKPIKPGTRWGQDFQCAWFRLETALDERYRGKQVVALVDLGGEACLVNKSGKPVQGLTPKYDDRQGGFLGPKREIRLYKRAKGNEKISLLFDVGANHLMGRQRRCEFRLSEVCVLNQEALTLYHEFRFLELLMLELEESSRHGQLILRCLNDVCNMVTNFTNEEIAAARGRLNDELSRPAKDSALKVSAIGHAHMDVAWLWPLRETVRKCARTFSTALRMMEEYPDYHFGASQPQLYQMIKDAYPSLYLDIRKAVANGRWEVQGGMWVESDCNIPSGESLVRQILHGKRFFKKEFGVEVDYLWLPDVFGYSAALPQILKKSRIEYFTTHKLNWNQFNTFPHHTMFWQGIDGTRIFSHFMTGNDYNVPCTPKAFMNYERENRDGDRTNHALCLYGIGDGGGGPGRTHIEWAQLAKNLEDLPRVTMEKAADFFPRAADEATDLMTWVGELYFEYHRGTYTTHGHVKKMNRKLELLIRDVEIAWAQLPAKDYPAAELDRLWKVILLNQFHDIIPGSSITRVYQEAHAQYEQAYRALNQLLADADARLASSIDTRGMANPRLVRNPLAWHRDALAFIPGERKILWDADGGAPITAQRVAGGLLLEVQVPPLGHVVIQTARGRYKTAPPPMTATEQCLENQLLRIEFDDSGAIARIYDKEHERDVLQADEQGNRFCLYEDLPLAYDAWDIDAYYMEKEPSHPTLAEVKVIEHGPLRGTIEQVYEGDNYRICQRISLIKGMRIIEFDTDVSWHEEEKMLRVNFPVNIQAAEANYEIQFGHVARPTHMNTSWDMARFEVVGHKWADISQPNYGVALLNDCKYGHQIHNSVISLNLLRSPRRPDPEADRHDHQFRYALYPHEGDLVKGEVVRRAWEFNVPVRVITAENGDGDPAHGRYFLAVDNDNVIIDTVKKAEDDDDLIIRMYECHGTDCRTKLAFGEGVQVENVQSVDLLEENGTPVRHRPGKVELAFSPFEIKTLKVTLAR